MAYLMNSAYRAAYATARSSLAALADQATGEDSCRYERALLALDQIHHGTLPAAYPLMGSRGDLLLWLEGAVEHMVALDDDDLNLELVLADVLSP